MLWCIDPNHCAELMCKDIYDSYGQNVRQDHMYNVKCSFTGLIRIYKCTNVCVCVHRLLLYLYVVSISYMYVCVCVCVCIDYVYYVRSLY